MVLEVLQRGDEGHRADRAVGGRERGGIEAVEQAAQELVAQHGHDQRQRDRAAQGGQDLCVETGLGQREAALEAERHQQVEREEARNRGRDLEVGADQTGKDAEDEEQDGGVEEVLHVAPSVIETGAMVESIKNK